MKKIKAVIFDMDGVLIDSETIEKKNMIKSAEINSLPFEDDFFELFLGCNNEMSYQILLDRYQDYKIVDKYLNDLEQLQTKEYKEGNIKLKPGTKEIIDYLRNNNIPYALATGSSYKYAKLDFIQNGYDKMPFDHIVTGDQIINSKPNPEIFIKAANLMNISINDCLVIEDSPKGIDAAYSSGAQSCFVPDLVKASESILSKATYHKNNLLEVIQLIESLIKWFLISKPHGCNFVHQKSPYRCKPTSKKVPKRCNSTI